LAIALLLACGGLVLWLERRTGPISRVLLSAALGALAFSYFRLILVAAFAERQAWFVFWEELSEFAYIVGIGAFVLSFRLSSVANALTRALTQIVRRAWPFPSTSSCSA